MRNPNPNNLTQPLFGWGGESGDLTTAKLFLFIVWLLLSFLLSALLARLWFKGQPQSSRRPEEKTVKIALILILAFVSIMLSALLADVIGISYRTAHQIDTLEEITHTLVWGESGETPPAGLV